MLAIIPPGEAPSRTSPTASSGGSPNSSAIAQREQRRDQRQVDHPDRDAARRHQHPPEVGAVSVMPRLHMITAIAAGSRAEVRIGRIDRGP